MIIKTSLITHQMTLTTVHLRIDTKLMAPSAYYHVIRPKLDPRQFVSISGTCSTDALVEMVHQWYEATDTGQTCVRILLLDYSKAFDLINHEILMPKLVDIGIPPHIVRWMAALLLNRRHIVKIGNITSNGGVPQGTLSGPKSFLVHINDLTTPCPMYKYVDDGTILKYVMQRQCQYYRNLLK